MRAEDLCGRRRRGIRRHDPRDDGAVADHDEPSAGLRRPVILFVQPGEPGIFEAPGRLGGGVVARGRGCDEIGEILGVREGCGCDDHAFDRIRVKTICTRSRTAHFDMMRPRWALTVPAQAMSACAISAFDIPCARRVLLAFMRAKTR